MIRNGIRPFPFLIICACHFAYASSKGPVSGKRLAHVDRLVLHRDGAVSGRGFFLTSEARAEKMERAMFIYA